MTIDRAHARLQLCKKFSSAIIYCRGLSEYPEYLVVTSDTSGLALNVYIA